MKNIFEVTYLDKTQKTFHASDVAAEILKSLKEFASKYIGEESVNVVLSIPAYYNNEQRKATLETGKLV